MKSKAVKTGMLAVLLLAGACQEQVNHRGRTPLAEVEGKFLYREDLLRVMPLGLSEADSAAFAQAYIRNWMEDELLYVNAERNVPDMAEIDRLVDNYRRSLVTHAYQQAMVEQMSLGKITDGEVEAFYNENPQLFVCEEALVRGVYVKVPLAVKIPNLFKVWYRKTDTEAVEKLEKFVFRNAVDYDYFYDRWLPVSELVGRLPEGSTKRELATLLVKEKHLEMADTAYRYFLNLNEVVKVGEVKPLECVDAEIREILTNQQKTRFVNQLKKELYELAVETGKVDSVKNKD